LKLLNEKIIKEKEELISKNKNNDINLIKSQYDSLLNEYNKLKQNDQINNDNDNDNEINELIKNNQELKEENLSIINDIKIMEQELEKEKSDNNELDIKNKEMSEKISILEKEKASLDKNNPNSNKYREEFINTFGFEPEKYNSYQEYIVFAPATMSAISVVINSISLNESG
jgi:hypothetical protein